MTTKAFSVGTYLAWGWKLMRKHFWFYAGVVVVAFLINALMGLSFLPYLEAYPVALWIIQLVAYIIAYTVMIGLYQVGLNLTQFGAASVWDLFVPLKKTIKVFIANWLYFLLVSLGLILLVVPGLYWFVKYSQITLLILDKDLGPLEAFKMSGEITDGAKWDLLALLVVVSFIGILGVLFFLIGVVVTVPFSILTQVLVYRHLVGGGEGEVAPSKSCCMMK